MLFEFQFLDKGVFMTSLTLERPLTSSQKQQPESYEIDQLMMSRYECPCCSNALLRHLYLGKIYWRCNRCYQAMPIMKDLVKRGAAVKDMPELSRSRISKMYS